MRFTFGPHCLVLAIVSGICLTPAHSSIPARPNSSSLIDPNSTSTSDDWPFYTAIQKGIDSTRIVYLEAELYELSAKVNGRFDPNNPRSLPEVTLKFVWRPRPRASRYEVQIDSQGSWLSWGHPRVGTYLSKPVSRITWSMVRNILGDANAILARHGYRDPYHELRMFNGTIPARRISKQVYYLFYFVGGQVIAMSETGDVYVVQSGALELETVSKA